MNSWVISMRLCLFQKKKKIAVYALIFLKRVLILLSQNKYLHFSFHYTDSLILPSSKGHAYNYTVPRNTAETEIFPKDGRLEAFALPSELHPGVGHFILKL